MTEPDINEQLDRACADGRMTVGDADVVREFAEFLGKCGPPPGRPGSDPARRRHHELTMGPPPHPAGCPGCPTPDGGTE